MTTTNIVIKQPSLSGATFKESLDLALVCAAFEHRVNLIFVDRGVLNLVTGQNAQLVADKPHTDLLKGLTFYDIDEIIVEEESLANFQLSTEELVKDTRVLSRDAILQLHSSAQHLVCL
jgi:tRNA 2-thiouridine synthesizing protein C